MGQKLERLLQRCTVKLSIPGKVGWGTGFLVAPGLILTCHHVVKDALNGSIDICWQNQDDFAKATIERSLPEFDLALLRFSPPVVDLPCIYLDESIESRDSLYTYGYPDDFSRGAPVIGECRGLTGDEPPLILFRAAQVRPGLSGSPLLNQRTGKVCGIVKFTLDRSKELGGGAVPTSEILSQFPELEELQQAFHRQDNRWTKLLLPPPSQTRLSRQEYRNRQALLNRVSKFWVKGVLERSLHNQVLIELGLEERPDAVAQPWNMVLQTPEKKTTTLPQGTKVINLFDEIGEGRTLIILGEPGSGKTTTLLELTRDLIERAEQDVEHLIPVVFNLSSWTVDKKKIEDWLVEELNSKYQVPKKIGQALVKEDKLLLLLDGLDEVKAEYREPCITALNHFNQRYCSEVVVCSRIKDYKALSNRLNFQSAVYLRLLNVEQVYHYLDSLGADADADLTGLRTLVEEDTALQELAQSPLMLNIMTLAYQGVAVEDLPKTDVVEEWQKQLFDEYIEKMFERPYRSKGNQRYSKLKPQAMRWLIWLAKRMLSENKSIFLIEELQPSWLSTNKKRWLYIFFSRIIGGLSFVAFFSILRIIKPDKIPVLPATLFSVLISGSFISFIDGYFWTKHNQYTSLKTSLNQQLLHLFFNFIASLLVFILFFKILIKKSSWTIGFPLGIFFGILFGLRGMEQNINRDIKSSGILKWSWKASINWAIIALIIGFIFSCVIGLMIPEPSTPIGQLIIMISGAIGCVFGGLRSVTVETAKKSVPNQGIQYSLRNAALGGTIGGIIGVLVGIFLQKDSYWPLGRVSLGISMGALWYGGIDVIQHLTLRVILYYNNYIPWNYARFLDYAAERIFLQKVGGGYIFIHRMLMEHFAKMELEN